MAVSLMGLVGSRVPHQFSLSVNEKELNKLDLSFQGHSNVLPFLFLSRKNNLSQCIEDLILRNNAYEDFDPDYRANYISKFSKVSGPYSPLFAWSIPVQIGGYRILLLHMAFDIDKCAKEEKETLKRMLHCLAAVTACCIVGKSTKKKGKIWTIFDKVNRQTKLSTGALLTVGDTIKQTVGLIKKNLPESPDESLGPFGCLFEHAFDDYLRSHEVAKTRLGTTTDRASAFVLVLNSFVSLAQMPFSYELFQQKLPDFTSANLRLNLDKLKKLKLWHEILIDQEEISLLDAKSNMKTTVFNQLLSKFDGQKPTIVVVLLASQGVGKSTFYNRLLQHLTESSTPYKCFKTSNEGVKTTRGGTVLPVPLNFPNQPDTQVMLLDLEGLKGLEIGDSEKKISQEKLLYSILTIASVPCIIVTNEEDKKPSVKEYVATISSCARSFGFKIERIIFLYYDRPYYRNKPESNESMTLWVTSLNDEYFPGKDIIKLMRKPNFADPANVEMGKDFFDDFISDLDKPKRKESGDIIDFRMLMGTAQYIATSDDGRSFAEISPNADDINQLPLLLICASVQIKEIFNTTTGTTPTCDLITPFTNAVRHLVISGIYARFSKNLYRFYIEFLKMQEAAMLAPLQEIQDQCRFLFEKQGQRMECLRQFALSYYYKSWSYLDYEELINCLIISLTEIQRRFTNFSLQEEINQVKRVAELGSWTSFCKGARMSIGLDTRSKYSGDDECLPLPIWKRYKETFSRERLEHFLFSGSGSDSS